jgi:DNA-binding transcriptional regulator GbsR (MarR family)
MLTDTQKKFILHWGEMGTKWGINRTVAQIHALLYISNRALHAEEITETLSVARSNVSTSIKELLGWGIVKVTHVLGDRRDHFETMTDVWEMFKIIVEERKRREIDPTLAVLHDCVDELKNDKSSDETTRERLEEMVEFFDTVNNAYDQFKDLSGSSVKKLVKSGAAVKKILKFGR